MIQLIIIAGLILGFVLLARLFGAWMLRIDEVIKGQNEIINQLKKLNAKNDHSSKR